MNDVGIVLGHEASTSQTFQVGLDSDRSLAVDDLVAVTIPEPSGEVIAYGVVSERYAALEGAQMPSDSALIADQVMPGALVRTADIQVIRVEPERWVAPHPAAAVRRAKGVERARALYEDTMTRMLAIGLASDGDPVHIDLDFLDGTKGGHVSISGISGVATKTSTALAIVRLLLEHADMTNRARVTLFNVKGEDLLHLDQPNGRYAENPERARLDDQWRALGLAKPGPFPSITVWAPPTAQGLPDCSTRQDVRVFGWTPWQFVVDGLLRFCFTDAADMRSQLSYLEERVRGELIRQAVPVTGQPGAVGLVAERRLASEPERRDPMAPSLLDAGPFTDLRGLVQWLVDDILTVDQVDRKWSGGAAQGTLQAFARRLQGATSRLAALVRVDAERIPRGPAASGEPAVTVVHLTPLHDFAQRFVVGTLLAETFHAKEQGTREPIELVVLDELNKYAPRDGDSPIKEILIDIAQRGRSLGVILIGCQQQASLVAPEVTQNAAIRIAGRLDAAEAERGEYGWLTPQARMRARLLRQGRVLVSQPSVPTALAVELPFPPWATTFREVDRAGRGDAAATIFGPRA